jgi:hypothetical protein
VDDEWDKQVQKILATDFSLIFPSKESLRMAIPGGDIKLPSSKCHVLVMTNTADPAAVEQPVETRVKLFWVAPPIRYVDRLLVGTREMGRTFSEDEIYLTNDAGPIQISFGG